MLEWFRKTFHKSPLIVLEREPDEVDDELEKGSGIFSTHFLKRDGGKLALMAAVVNRIFQRGPDDVAIVNESGMDAAVSTSSIKGAFGINAFNVTDNQLAYFGSQGFIGYQLMAIIAQNWLVVKACKQPAKDAVRNGFKIATDDGVVVPPEVLSYLDKCDKRYNLTKNLVDFVYFGRVFGIRIAMFDVVSSDEEYYVKPFNPDGITPGSYRGISQIDPYWITPELNGEAAANPASRNFYEPTYWRVNGNRIHRSHLIIFKGDEVADILKPTYMYGGVSVTQKIFERVYAAERTANEAPMLAQSKRETVLHVDVDKAIANQAVFEEKMGVWAQYRNNFGIKIVGIKEEIEQFETSLADLDEVIMTQYQLVASTAGVPVTKLLGTVPKGFNSTGEYDESSYHEELESIQTHDMQRLIERHHICVMRSDMRRKFPAQPLFEIAIQWNSLDALTAEEQATVNKLKAETGQILVTSGAIDGEDERLRLINDEYSDYNGIAMPTDELLDDADETVIN
jgi:phage-related protein (TIGR01555 family)